VSAARRRRARYTDADDPKQLVEVDRALHGAVEAFGARRIDEAVRIYESVLAQRPDMTIAYRHLAFISGSAATRAAPSTRCSARSRRRHAAIDCAQLGSYLADTGRAAEAVRLVEPLARRGGRRCRHAELARHRLRPRGPPREARRIFERVLALDPESSVPLENLGMLALERGDLADARRHFERALRADPRSSRRTRTSGWWR
jgi:tetratricopeptide (TPR) repeat protein